MGNLPSSRNTTYTAASPVLSADLNDLQDMIIGMKFLSHWRWKKPGRTGYELHIDFDDGSGAYRNIKANADGALYYGFELCEVPEGTRVTGVGAVAYGTHAGENMQVVLQTHRVGVGDLVIATLNITNPVATETIYTAAAGSPHTLAAGEALWVNCSLPKSGDIFYSFGVQIDRL